MSYPRQLTKESREPEYFATLRRGTWFASLPESIARVLFDAGSVSEYASGQVISSENGRPDGLSAVLDGTVHIETVDPAGRRVLLHTAPTGSWFGDVTMSHGLHTLLMVRAFRPTYLWRIPVFGLKRVMQNEPNLVDGLATLRTLWRRVLIEMLCIARRPGTLSQVAGRLALIDRLYKQCDMAAQMSVIHMTQSDLADMTGHSRQTINAVVSQLEKERLIRVGHRRIEILESERLENFG
jgi:CRP/FNR family cyclic AMP-dependent transcriptional regulator